MHITPEEIKDLRTRTGLSVMDCKHALEETGGDMEKALIVLRKVECCGSKESRPFARCRCCTGLRAFLKRYRSTWSHSLVRQILLRKNEEFVALAQPYRNACNRNKSTLHYKGSSERRGCLKGFESCLRKRQKRNLSRCVHLS